LWVFSSSTPFEPERSYGKFGAYTVLEHGGDYTSAAKALVEAGYVGDHLIGAKLTEGRSGDVDGSARAVCKAASAHEPPTAVPSSPVPNGLTLTPLGTLLSEPDERVEWVVEDRIRTGSVNMLSGKPKAGKSTLVRDLALQVAVGGQWLAWQCSKGQVWYLAFEDKRSEVKRHFQSMGASADTEVKFFFDQAYDALIAELRQLAATEKPALIIVDTLQRLVRAKDLNDYAEVTTRLTPLLTLARETNAAVLLVHHAGKGERSGIDASLGSTALTGSVDNVFHFARHERYRTFSSIQRIGPDVPETVVLLDEQTGRVSAGHSRHDADVAEIQGGLTKALADATEPLTESQLCELVEGRTQLKRDALRRLPGVRRVGEGKRGDPFRYSLILVPTSIREQENENPNTAVTPREHCTNARSRDFELLGGRVENREQAFAAIEEGEL